MADLQGGGTDEKTTAAEIKEDAYLKNEMILTDYLRVIWKQKWFILPGSIIPTLLIGLIIFLSPRDYTVIYTYDVKDQFKDQFSDQTTMDVSSWNLDEKNYNVLISRFYSEENLNKIIDKLQKNGCEEYAKRISSGSSESNKFVEFKVVPPFLDLSNLNVTNPDHLGRIRGMKALLLNVTITGKPREDMHKISSVIRDNIEKVVPVYMLQEQLASDIRSYKTKMSDIENNRFGMELVLKADKVALEKLKKIKFEPSNKPDGDIMLQFDVGGDSEYLPVSYQIQAVESKIVEFEKKISMDEQSYSYYGDLLALKEKLSAMLKDKSSSYYTIEQFNSFLTDLVNNYNNRRELKDYLNSYIKKVENRISKTVPITENPSMSQIAKGTVKKSATVFAAALMISVFTVFLLEGLKRSKI